MYVKGSVICSELQISESHLLRLRRNGTLIKNKHYIDVSGRLAMRQSYRYDLDMIEKDFKERNKW